MTGYYITAFVHTAYRVPRLTDDQKLDKFLRSLWAPIPEKVLMADITTFTNACHAIERAAAFIE